MVGRKHLGGERRDAVLLGHGGEMGQEDRRDPVPLPFVRDQEGHLGARRVDPDVGGVGQDAPRDAGLGHQGKAIGIVDVQRPRGHPIEIGSAEEPEADRLR